jgi:S-DNA-T family DNA segregation ATPase FtsK/SpoIIIE
MNPTQNLNTQAPYLDRPPRIQPPLPQQEIEIPPPPDKKSKGQSLVQLFLPLVSILGYSLVSVFGGRRNILFMIPMALSIVVSISFAVYSFLQERKRIRELEQAYANRLRMMRSDMEAAQHEQHLYFEHTHPNIDTVYDIGFGKQESRMGQRLWERRIGDHDFASLRLGLGDIPSRVVYTLSNSGSVDEDPQIGEAMQLAEDSHIIRAAPVTVPLHSYQSGAAGEQTQVIGRHSMGISGNVNYVMDVTRAFIMQLAAFNTPADLQIYILGAPDAGERWTWAKWLPHTNTRLDYEGSRMCFQPPLAENEDPKKTKRMFPKRFLAQINKDLEERRLLLEEDDSTNGSSKKTSHPFICLIIDNLPKDSNSHKTTEWLDSITSEAAVSSILQNGQTLNAAILFLVPHNSKIPSDCTAVCEVTVTKEDYSFRYSETGQNPPRFIGTADHINDYRAEEFARAIRDKQIRRSYGADLKNSISMLELYNARTIEDVQILQYWEQSKRTGKNIADWLRVAIGVRSGDDLHELYFNQDYDGVHGMIAGTTGSGKSELLLTLIAGLAVNYDPTILNFVLVDYKGGAAFEPFRELPHCVDIVTNLDGKAVDRMFVAIDAELKRRSKVLADYKVKHIVEYREKGYHLKDPFPHLFIVVDEFAEMINENAEYKSRFDSITRLGRAIGVNLILATQRPSGVVTDQMRANMKLRICLRVETGDDSRELLGRSDAMFLPSGIPGRAYLQVGKETPILMQVARAGGDYMPPTEDDVMKDISIGSRQVAPKTDETEIKTIVDLVVAQIIDNAAKHSKIQYKPWPDPLPTILPLNQAIDAVHLNTTRTKSANNKIYLHQGLRAWMELDKGSENPRERVNLWKKSQLVQWGDGQAAETKMKQRALLATIGLIDIPSMAEQRILTLNLTEGPIVLFGAGGWGKTTFLKTLLTSLAATHSPDELWIYALDFARGGLADLIDLPHLETPINVMEEARVERLLRMLTNMLDDRGAKVREYGSILQYNAKNPNSILPAVLVVVDNFAEFKETYENLIPQLSALVRDGRALGIYFVVTADQVNAVPTKLYSLFTQRLTLKMADSGDYQAIVGRAAHLLTEVTGRGAIAVDREPREFHIGVITQEKQDQTQTQYDENFEQYYRTVAGLMKREWAQASPVPKVEALSQKVALADLQKSPAPIAALSAAVGIRDIDRRTAWLEFGTHCLILGTPLSGRTTLLQTILLSLCERYTPEQVSFVLIDPKRSMFDYRMVYPNAANHLANLPHVLQTVYETEDLDKLDKYLQAEFYPETQTQLRRHAEQLGLNNVFLATRPATRHIVFIVDNYDDMADLARPKIIDRLAELARKYRDVIHLIICGTPELLRNRDTLIKRVDSARYALVLQSVETVKNMGGKVNFNLNLAELPAGRGFFLKSGRTDLFQTARLGHADDDESYAVELDKFIASMKNKHDAALWYFQGSESFLENAYGKPVPTATAEPKVEYVETSAEVDAHMQRILNNAAKPKE